MNLNDLTQQEKIQSAEATFISKVFMWMTGALILTGIIAQYVASTDELIYTIATNRILFFGLIIAEFACVIYLTAALNKMTFNTAVAVFLGYAMLNGLTLSVIFAIYTAESIATTFYVTAGTFAVMAAYGYYTKSDLTRIGNLAFMGLVGIIIASFVNFFLKSETLYWIVTYIGILVFVGLIAYDTQKIKRIGQTVDVDSEQGKKTAIIGALSLYLDFINLFLMLLRLFGNRK